MSAALVEAVSITVKYDTKFSNGQTRRERAAGFGYESPIVDVPDYAYHVWRWFWSLRHTKAGYDDPINFQDVQAWRNMTGNLILPVECDILMLMDASFRSAARLVSKQDEELMQTLKKGGRK